MKTTLVAYGTRGDVQPFLTIAWALRRLGDDITLVGPANFAGWSARAEVPFEPLPIDTKALFSAPEGQRMLARGDIRAFFAWLQRIEAEHTEAIAEVLLRATEGCDAILTHALMEDRCAAIGAARRIPVAPLYFFPIPPTSLFASPFITTRELPFAWLRRLTHTLLLDMLWRASREDVARLRRRLSVAPARESFVRQSARRGLPSLLAYSAALSPRPSDWHEGARVVGSIRLPEALREVLEDRTSLDVLGSFLDGGAPPVYLGFGSMPVLEPLRLVEQIADALRRTGARAVLGAGWSTLSSAPSIPDLAIVDQVDHDWLLPRCRSAIHHGGSGTVHATLGAGLPTGVFSVFADQPYWGARLARLGVGRTRPFPSLSAGALADMIVELDPCAVRAKEVARAMSREDGLSAALRFVREELPTVPIPE